MAWIASLLLVSLPSFGRQDEAPALELEDAVRLYAELRLPGDQLFDAVQHLRQRASLRTWRRFDEHPQGGWLVRTNSLGMWSDSAEPLAPDNEPDWRILILGDEQVGGSVPNDESVAAHLQAALEAAQPTKTVEVLCAAVPGHGFDAYAGALRNGLALKPDLVLVCVHGGNDFAGVLDFDRRARGLLPRSTPAEPLGKLVRRFGELGGLLTGELLQALRFAEHADDEPEAARAAIEVTERMETEARGASVQLVWVYLPPLLRGEPERLIVETKAVLAAIEQGPEVLAASDRVADEWLERARRAGAECVDARPTFRRSETPLRWRIDSRLNTAGHRALFEVVLSTIEEQLP
jgi:alkylhydroperoxidase/carboxymuconolactone decarboxylase family protein YurZ